MKKGGEPGTFYHVRHFTARKNFIAHGQTKTFCCVLSKLLVLLVVDFSVSSLHKCIEGSLRLR